MIIEAMKQAADTLEIGLAYPGMRFYHDNIRAAITALRAAIAEAENQEPVAWMDASETALSWENYLDGMKPLYTAPPAAQPEQEPVWDASAPIVMTPHPAFAQRQWVGLTDEEIDDADCVELEYIGSGDYVVNGESVYKFAIAIEAKLKEKNT
jgi:hypothetical protein